MITSKDNENVKYAAKLIRSTSFRRKCGLFAAEGVRLCLDGVRSGFAPELFVFTSSAAEKHRIEFEKISACTKKSMEVSSEIFEKISDTKSPQGFLCVFNMLDKPKFPYKINNEGKYLACERIQDPSNLGTMLRTAEALGFEGVILSGDCCDLFSPKVVRGSMGAVFRMPAKTADDLAAYISQLSAMGIETYASTPRKAKDIRNVSFNGGVMLIGNEGSGLSERAIDACSQRVMIPMEGRAESLNAAAAASILMWEMCSRPV